MKILPSAATGHTEAGESLGLDLPLFHFHAKEPSLRWSA